ncbi:hypothetical protein CGCF413_v005560 [Colletotrichum fructicola]|nr:hypothetical protein CGCF413_v005560 [Colletotrichum fructicola]
MAIAAGLALLEHRLPLLPPEHNHSVFLELGCCRVPAVSTTSAQQRFLGNCLVSFSSTTGQASWGAWILLSNTSTQAQHHRVSYS